MAFLKGPKRPQKDPITYLRDRLKDDGKDGPLDLNRVVEAVVMLADYSDEIRKRLDTTEKKTD